MEFRADDFLIEVSDENMTAFFLLQMACIQLCKVSFNISWDRHQKRSSRNGPYDGFIYNTMMWGMYYVCIFHGYLVMILMSVVSLYLKVGSHRGESGHSEIWKKKLISESPVTLSLNNDQIDELQRGLLFGEIIKLPQDLRPDADLMCNMLVPCITPTLHYFTHLK